MFTTTQQLILPTTVTGSWPRPRWFDKSLWGRRLSDAMTDIDYREKLLDAVAAVLSDQEQAGLDILTNGDYHLDESLGGLSWLLYPLERMQGVAREERPLPPARSGPTRRHRFSMRSWAGGATPRWS